MSVAILGAGISGISAGYHASLLGVEAKVYEQDSSWGGLCGNFMVDGFRFDKAVHLSFTQDERVRRLFDLSVDSLVHAPLAFNYYKGYWIKHPAQNNIFPLEVAEKIDIIMDFINRDTALSRDNYEEWLRYQYGNYFAENFPMRYTRKYWTLEAREITTSWIGNRMYRPSIQEVLHGAMTDTTPNTYYASEMRYPKTGGYRAYLNYMAERCTIVLNKKAVSVDPKSQRIDFQDGSHEYYEYLISSIPLPDMVRLIKGTPKEILEAGNTLCTTSMALVSLAFKRSDIPKYLWLYIYDESILPARAYSPSLKSPDNTPSGKSSLQFEVYFSRYKSLPVRGDDLVEHVVNKAVEMALFERNDIEVVDYRELAHANVIFDKHIEENRTIVHRFLEQHGIIAIGRFGEWDYLWSDQSLLSGIRGVERLRNMKNRGQ